MAGGNEQKAISIEDLIASGAIVAHKDGNYGSKYPRVEEFGPQGVPFLTAKSLRDGFVDIDGAPKLAEARANELTFGFVEPDDVLLSHNATIGRVAVVPAHKGRLLVGTSLTYFRLNPKKLLPRYLAMYMEASDFQHQLTALMSHSTRNQVPVTAQRNLRVVVPPLAEQRAIAHILGTLDEKIELNRRRNATLEAIARALFKAWFVDFEPVRAKLEGRWQRGQSLPGLPAHLYDLFPDRLIDSELGEIPEGWSVSPLGEHIEAERGLSYKGEGLCEHGAGLPMHNLNSVHEGGGYKYEGIKFYAGEYRNKHVVHPGDMIVTNTEQGFDHLLIGNAAIVPSTYGARGLFSHHLFRVRMKPASPFMPDYLVRLFNHPHWHQVISGFSNGTTINMLPLDALGLPVVVVPPADLIAKFSAIASNARAIREANRQESASLAALRDTLLPKLISGELLVKGQVHAEMKATL